MLMFAGVLWQTKEGPRLVKDIGEAGQAAIEGDQIEKIAMLARRGVGPFACGSASMVGAVKPDEQAAAGSVGDVAHEPVAACAAPVAEIVATHGVGLRGETAREIGDGARHGGAPQSAARAQTRTSG
jgi:hypothetical protein